MSRIFITSGTIKARATCCSFLRSAKAARVKAPCGVANDSVGRRGWPALRVKALTEARGAAQFRDEEVLPGVEDLQVEFGVRDPADPDQKLSFIAPDLPGLRQRRVVAVRLWLRIRADRTEPGYVDSRPLGYAGVEFMPDAFEAKQRRTLLTRTVALRNTALP